MVRRLIICFLIVTLLQLNLHCPKAAEARRLLDDISLNDSGKVHSKSRVTGSESEHAGSNATECKGQSKSGVTGSESKHAGSATNDSPPDSTATVEMPPPTAVTTIGYVNGGSAPPSGNSNNYYSPPAYPQNGVEDTNPPWP